VNRKQLELMEPFRRNRSDEQSKKVVPFGVKDYVLSPGQIEFLRLLDERFTAIEATLEALQDGCPIANRIRLEMRQSAG
jgi:hypothetical protein